MLVNNMLNITQPCALTARKASCAWACIKNSVDSRVREGILPIYSALMRPHSECCVQLWGTLK